MQSAGFFFYGIPAMNLRAIFIEVYLYCTLYIQEGAVNHS